MEKNEYGDGVPCWVDVSAPDMAASTAFYRDLFGWEIEQGPPQFGGYSNALLRGRRVAGVMPLMGPEMPPVWSTYLKTSDADATIAAVAAHGGTVIAPPMDVGTEGRMALFVDGAGAFIGIWQPGEHRGAQLVNEPGTMCWNELVADDIEAAKTFYAAVFGWEFEESAGDGGRYIECRVDGVPVAGMMPRPPGMPTDAPPYWGVYFAVVDCDATVARATELGGSSIVPVMDIPQGRFGVLMDPGGAVFSVIALAEGMGG